MRKVNSRKRYQQAIVQHQRLNGVTFEKHVAFLKINCALRLKEGETDWRCGRGTRGERLLTSPLLPLGVLGSRAEMTHAERRENQSIDESSLDLLA